MAHLFIMCGLGFSGKSTLAKKIAGHYEAKLVSTDAMFTELGLESDNYQQWLALLETAKERIRDSLKQGVSVVYDHPNVKLSERNDLRKIAIEAGADAIVVYLTTPIETLTKRQIKNRTTKERHDPKQEHLDAVLRDFEPPAPPEVLIKRAPSQDIDLWLGELEQFVKLRSCTPHSGPRLYITGIPTAGKSYLAKLLAEKVGGITVCLDDTREELVKGERYRKWVNFYLDQDEERYLTETPPEELWNNLVRQSEALWPALLEKINSYCNETRPVIFECVNLLPHLAKDLGFPGIVLLGNSYEETLERNIKDPRWGNTKKLQELEAKTFWEVERQHYQREAEAFRIMAFTNSGEAYNKALELLEKDVL